MSRVSNFHFRTGKLVQIGGTLIGIVGFFLFAKPMEAATVAYWRFEEGPANAAATGTGTIVDVSGNNLNGTPVNGPTYQTNVSQSPVTQTGSPNDYAMNFNGINQQITIPDNPLFNLHSLTLEADVFPLDGGDNGHPENIIFRGDDHGGLYPYRLEVFNNVIGFYFTNSSGVVDGLEAPIPQYSQWYHVAVTLDDATGAMKLYFNGSLVSSSVTAIRPFSPLDPSAHPGIGIGNTTTSHFHEYFNGMIDEVRISDVALSPSQFLWSVPEPGTFVLFALGVLGLCSAARARHPRQKSG